MKVTLYHANWCGHCVRFQDDWKTISEKLKNMKVDAVSFEETANPQVMTDNKINSYPTLHIENDKGDITPYSGERTVDSVLKTVKQLQLQQSSDSTNIYFKKYQKYKNKYLKIKK
jgi:thiol-disulfide isomerase/thioredoxin